MKDKICIFKIQDFHQAYAFLSFGIKEKERWGNKGDRKSRFSYGQNTHFIFNEPYHFARIIGDSVYLSKYEHKG